MKSKTWIVIVVLFSLGTGTSGGFKNDLSQGLALDRTFSGARLPARASSEEIPAGLVPAISAGTVLKGAASYAWAWRENSPRRVASEIGEPVLVKISGWMKWARANRRGMAMKGGLIGAGLGLVCAASGAFPYLSTRNDVGVFPALGVSALFGGLIGGMEAGASFIYAGHANSTPARTVRFNIAAGAAAAITASLVIELFRH